MHSCASLRVAVILKAMFVQPQFVPADAHAHARACTHTHTHAHTHTHTHTHTYLLGRTSEHARVRTRPHACAHNICALLQTYRHSLAATTVRPDSKGVPYLYTLNLSCRQDLWDDLQPLFKVREGVQARTRTEGHAARTRARGTEGGGGKGGTCCAGLPLLTAYCRPFLVCGESGSMPRSASVLWEEGCFVLEKSLALIRASNGTLQANSCSHYGE